MLGLKLIHISKRGTGNSYSTATMKEVLRSYFELPKVSYLHIPGARPTMWISIEFEIRSKFGVLWFKMCSTDHNEILHMSRQYYCRDKWKNLLRLAEYLMNKSITNFHWISNSIEISLVGWVPAMYGMTMVSILKKTDHILMRPNNYHISSGGQSGTCNPPLATFFQVIGLTILIPYHLLKSLQLIWRYGTSRLHLQGPRSSSQL